jgi:hypothetical protein
MGQQNNTMMGQQNNMEFPNNNMVNNAFHGQNTACICQSSSQSNSGTFQGSNIPTESDLSFLQGLSVSYETFQVKWSPYYDRNAPNMFVRTRQFGQGVLLDHDIGTQQVRVQLADGDIMIIPVSEMAIHRQHKTLSFQEFMQEQQVEQQRREAMENTLDAMTAGGHVGGSVRPNLKRDRDAYGDVTHANSRPHNRRK